jgi:hypothetical protein
MGHYSMEDDPYYYSGWNLTDEANYHNKPIRFNYGATVSWTVNSSTILDLRAGGLYLNGQGAPPKRAIPTGLLSGTLIPNTAGGRAVASNTRTSPNSMSR